MSIVIGLIIGLTAFIAFVAGGIVGYMQALSDCSAEELHRKAHANGMAEWKPGGKL